MVGYCRGVWVSPNLRRVAGTLTPLHSRPAGGTRVFGSPGATPKPPAPPGVWHN